MKSLVPQFLKNFYKRLLFSLALVYYGVNLNNIKFIGVTGTSGKTTTSSMIFHVLRKNGFKVGLISTVGVIAENENIQTGFHVTTPDPVDLVNFIKVMQDKNMEYIVLESSSHALAQGRMGSIKYDFAVYTNITNDHLDWHRTWENYAKAKAKMIDNLKADGRVIINKDDFKSYEFLSKYSLSHGAKIVVYSLNEVENRKESLEGVMFTYKDEDYSIKVLGEYNMSNALAAIKLGEVLGIDGKRIAQSFEDFRTVQGRMEIFQLNPFTVILDFAHNKDSLEKSLKTAKKLVRNNGKLISIFGSAGLRDINKRFEMGEVSGQLSDITIVTAEDPRTEKLFNINTEILNGLEKNGAKLIRRFKNHSEYLKYLEEIKNSDYQTVSFDKYLETEAGRVKVQLVFIFDEENVSSRFDAIDLAIKIAKKGDVVITNGKGHERSLAFGTVEYPFSDADAIKRALKTMNN